MILIEDCAKTINCPNGSILLFYASIAFVVLQDNAECVSSLTLDDLEAKCGDIGKFWGDDVNGLCPYVFNSACPTIKGLIG